MRPVSLDRLLAVLVVAMVATGLLTLRAGTPAAGWVVVLHGLLAGALGLAVVLKIHVSVPRAVRGRRWRSLAMAAVLGLAICAALAGGWFWAASGGIPSFRGFTVLVLHAWVGLVLLPLAVLHLLPRRWRAIWPRQPRRVSEGAIADGGSAKVRLTRRSLLVGAAFALAGGSTYAAATVIEAIRGGSRRFTGSRFLPAGGIPFPTTFYGEPAPDIDLAAWRLRVTTATAEVASLTLAELKALGGVNRVAILDCTSGWALETTWRGVPLGTLLDRVAPAGVREVTARSATGWAAVLPLAEARDCLLAWGVAGVDLPHGNGAPLRLVVPERRGLDWVKWVVTIEVA
ncbi:MAG: molybdopterin-dependent oxidoreductase [Chloroflexi bacterium]|nr:molybdopterin-dependent oxidoreductase [Chloroflexota bacterium]